MVNFSCKLGQIMIRYDFLWHRKSYLIIICPNLHEKFNGLDEWFWAMFELTPTWHNFTFGQLFMWFGANNDQIWLPMDQTSDSEQCSNRLQLHLILLLVNFSCELGQIMIRYDFLWTRLLILSNVRTYLMFEPT